MWAWIVSLFLGPFGKILQYITIGLVVAGFTLGGYQIWKNQVEQAALLKFNQKQMEQVVKDQQKYIQEIQALQEQEKLLTEQLNQKNDTIDKLSQDVSNWLNSPAAQQQDRPSSSLLKETIKRLSQ